MDLLLIECNSCRRVAIARHLCQSGHLVTLASSIGEAEEMMRFVRNKSAAPAVVLIAEALLGNHSAAFRAELADRFPCLAWVPVPADVDLEWLQNWIERAVTLPSGRARRCLDVLFIETDSGVRREVKRRLSAMGDRVVACSSIAQARTKCDTTAAFDVLIAPVTVDRSDTISLFLAAKKVRPGLRWIMSSPEKTGRMDLRTAATVFPASR